MFLSDASIKRPVAMGCLIIALSLLGLNSFRKMSKELMPRIDIPYVTITTVYPGASPEEIEIDIARRIEDAVASIDGLKNINSYSMENVCMVILEFDLAVSVDVAAMDVREKIDLVRAKLPGNAQDPIIMKQDIGAMPIATLALTGRLGVDEMYDYADNQLRDRLSAVRGVADVTLIGGAEREVQILLDREELAARGLTSVGVVGALQTGVVTIPSGRVLHGEAEYGVTFRAEYDSIADIENLEIANQNGQRVYLRDVGRAVMGTAELRQISELNGQPAIAINIVKRADANTVDVIKRVEQQLDTFRREMPEGMDLVLVSDEKVFTESMNNGAWMNVLEGVLITAGILFFFLYNVRTLIIVAVTMPLTIIIGLFFLHSLNFSLNAPTLMAIGMSVGVLVTNSIVVLESIIKHLDLTNDPVEASRKGAAEAFIPVLASAGTNIVVLFPLSILGSMFGIIIRYFALTTLVLTAVSLFVSFTLTPLMCSILLKPRSKERKGVLDRMETRWNKGFDKFLRRYRAILVYLERRRSMALLLMLGVLLIFLHSLALIGNMGTSTGSEMDMAEVGVRLEFPSHYSLDKTREQVSIIQQNLDGIPHVKHILSSIGKVGGAFTEGVYLAEIKLKFNERTERKETIGDLMDIVRERVENFPDARITLYIPGGMGGQRWDLDLEIVGTDFDQLDALAIKTEEITAGIAGVSDTDTSSRPGKPQLRVEPIRPILSDLGLSPFDLGMILRGNLEGIEAGTFKMGSRNYEIKVKMDQKEGVAQLREFAFPGAPGRPLMLESFSKIEEHRAPLQIIRKNKERVATINANLSSDLPLGSAVTQISSEIDRQGYFPEGYRYRFGGMFEFLGEIQKEMVEAGLIAIILVTLTLAAILESFKQPFLILITLPLTVIGVAWSLALTGNSMEVFVMMSGVMMIGIVVNNAILIMDQFNIYVAEGYRRSRAMIQASIDRFRPVVMITLAAVLGMLPMAVSRSIGAELRNVAGIASMGGILISGVLTLIVMPVLYDLFVRRNNRKRRKQK